MKNQPNEQAGGASANKGGQKAPNSELESGTKSTEKRSPGREGMDAPRNEQGNRGAAGNRNEQGNEPGKQPNVPAKPGPQYDDRPDHVRQDERGTQQAPGSALPNRGTPNYGDAEPNDPRKLDVDAGTGGRAGSGDRSNRS